MTPLARRPRHYIMLRNLTLLLFLAAVVCALQAAACRPTPPLSQNGTTLDKLEGWELSGQALLDYYHLVLEDASRAGDLAAAQDAVSQLEALEPSPRIYADLANILLFQGKISEARRALEKGLAKYPDDSTLSLLYAESQLAGDDLGFGLNLLEQYLRDHNPDSQQRLQAAELLLRIALRSGSVPGHDQEQVAALYRKTKQILEGIPDGERDKYFHYFYGRALIGLNDRRGEAFLREAVKEEPQFMEAWAEIAYLMESRNDLAGAVEVYATMLEINPENTAIWLRLIQINLKLNRLDEAVRLALEGPRDANFLLNAASLFMDENHLREAEQILLAAQGIPDVSDDVYYYLGVIAYQAKDDWREAVGRLAQIRTDSANFERANQLRLRILMDEHQFDEAAAAARAAREAHAEEPKYWIMEGLLLASFDRFEAALQVLKEAGAAFRGNSEVLFATGTILEQAGRHAEALAVMEEIVRIDPHNAQALNYIGYTLAEQNRELDRALKLIEQANRFMPDSPHILDSLAWVHYRLKNYQEAWRYINRAVELEEREPVIWEHYGDIAGILGFTQDARRGWNKALELGPDNAGEIEKKLENP